MGQIFSSIRDLIRKRRTRGRESSSATTEEDRREEAYRNRNVSDVNTDDTANITSQWSSGPIPQSSSTSRRSSAHISRVSSGGLDPIVHVPTITITTTENDRPEIWADEENDSAQEKPDIRPSGSVSDDRICSRNNENQPSTSRARQRELEDQIEIVPSTSSESSKPVSGWAGELGSIAELSSVKSVGSIPKREIPQATPQEPPAKKQKKRNSKSTKKKTLASKVFDTFVKMASSSEPKPEKKQKIVRSIFSENARGYGCGLNKRLRQRSNQPGPVSMSYKLKRLPPKIPEPKKEVIPSPPKSPRHSLSGDETDSSHSRRIQQPAPPTRRRSSPGSTVHAAVGDLANESAMYLSVPSWPSIPSPPTTTPTPQSSLASLSTSRSSTLRRSSQDIDLRRVALEMASQKSVLRIPGPSSPATPPMETPPALDFPTSFSRRPSTSGLQFATLRQMPSTSQSSPISEPPTPPINTSPTGISSTLRLNVSTSVSQSSFTLQGPAASSSTSSLTASLAPFGPRIPSSPRPSTRLHVSLPRTDELSFVFQSLSVLRTPGPTSSSPFRTVSAAVSAALRSHASSSDIPSSSGLYFTDLRSHSVPSTSQSSFSLQGRDPSSATSSSGPDHNPEKIENILSEIPYADDSDQDCD